jgi:hypothetical protein
VNAGDDAADLLIFYMRRVWEEAGLNWQSDNSAEMRTLVDKLIQAAGEPDE